MTIAETPTHAQSLEARRATALRLSIILALVALAMIGSILALDRPLALWLQRHLTPSSHLRQAAELVGWLGEGGCLAVPLLIGALLYWHRSRARALALLLTPLVWLTSVVTAVWLKMFFGRCRPVLLNTEGAYGFRWLETERLLHSFPSGHTTGVIAVATMLWYILPRWRALWLAGGLLMALSRIVALHHYASDTLAGALWGILIARFALSFLPPALNLRDQKPPTGEASHQSDS